jgi:xanthine dehydrogenase accessory factor
VTRDVLDRVLADAAARRAVVVATDLATGDATVLDPLAPGDGPLAAAAREAAVRDQSRVVEGPAGAAFLRVFNPPVRVVVIGAVHVTQALAPMVKLAGYDVVVVDPRGAFATEARFPGVPLVVAWPDEGLAQVGLDRRTAVVALTHDPKLDDPALAAALRSEAFYVGALGSRRTQAARLERLRALGLDEPALARIHGPVGLAIGAVSPGEIAASIVAELVASLRAVAPRERR